MTSKRADSLAHPLCPSVKMFTKVLISCPTVMQFVCPHDFQTLYLTGVIHGNLSFFVMDAFCWTVNCSFRAPYC